MDLDVKHNACWHFCGETISETWVREVLDNFVIMPLHLNKVYPSRWFGNLWLISLYSMFLHQLLHMVNVWKWCPEDLSFWLKLGNEGEFYFVQLWGKESIRIGFCGQAYVRFQLIVQNVVSTQPCVRNLAISLVLLNFLYCNLKLWFKTT